jgi:hypothetical protein
MLNDPIRKHLEGKGDITMSPLVTSATGAPPVNRTYIKVLIGWNTSTKAASDEFGFRKLEIYPRNCQSTLRRPQSGNLLLYNLEGDSHP